MQRCQQRNNKQIAVLKTQRPALALLLLQVFHQLRDVMAQVAQRPGVLTQPGNRRFIRAWRGEPAGERKGLLHCVSRLITWRRTSHSPAINAPISR